MYRKVGEVLLKDERTSLPVNISGDADFIKVVLKSPHHTLNYWLYNVNFK